MSPAVFGLVVFVGGPFLYFYVDEWYQAHLRGDKEHRRRAYEAERRMRERKNAEERRSHLPTEDQ